MKVKPLVSVVIPCYNQGSYLEETLRCVLNQTYEFWECIVIDDGSTDETCSIALSYVERDTRFLYLKKENGGLSSARNAGMRIAKGEFLQLLDSDDLIEKQKLEKQVAILIKNPHIALVYSEARYFESNNLEDHYYSFQLSNDEWMTRLSGKKEIIIEQMLLGNIMACNCPLFRAQCIKAIGYFDENLFNHEDYDYWIRMALEGFYFHFDNSLHTKALVRVHLSSMSKNTKMSLGFSIVQLKLLIAIGKLKINIPVNKEIIKHEKKKLVRLYLCNEIKTKHLKMVLSFGEKIKLAISSILPRSLKYYFLVLNYGDIKKRVFK